MVGWGVGEREGLAVCCDWKSIMVKGENYEVYDK
jgi:hypothetical protein